MSTEWVTLEELAESARAQGLKIRGDGNPDRRSDVFNPAPLDYHRLIAEGLSPVEYLDPPYIPARVSVWATGPTGSAKSIWALSTSCSLSRRGIRVSYHSQENPRDVELRRLERLHPNPEFLELYHYEEFDLARREHVEWIKANEVGAGLIVFDTLTACWSGDENDNAAVVAFDRDVIRPIIEATGATVLTLDHTGHPTAFVPRKGVSAARGASSKGQKADFFLEFRSEDRRRFLIHHGKNRVTGINEPDRTFEVVDTEDDLLGIVQVENAEDERVRETAEAMVEFILAADQPPSTNELRAAMRGVVGKDSQTSAMEVLRLENPRRVVDVWGKVDSPKGWRRAKVWKPAPPEMPHI
jgi:hypothetical protein